MKQGKQQLIEFRRHQILKEAQNQFSKRGFHQTNISHIAKGLGIGHGTIYRYFKSKRDIFENLLEMISGKVFAAMGNENPTASKDIAQYKEQVIRIGNKLLEIFVKDDSLSQIFHYESWGLDNELRLKVREIFDTFGNLTRLYLTNGKERGFLREDLDTEFTAYLVNASIFEAAKRISIDEVDVEEIQERWVMAVTNFMFQGIAAQSS